jgi:hypothetical protein
MNCFVFKCLEFLFLLVNYSLSCFALIHTMDTVLETTLSVLNSYVIYYY